MPDVREKLVELQRNARNYLADACSGHSCEDCPYNEHGNSCDFVVRAEYLIANGVTIQRWIPVTERLPDKRIRVLVLTEWKGMIVARHTEVGWVVSWNNAQCPKITHWMPLPEPPKEE